MDKNRTALVVEGGGMRGIFAAGVLDSFLLAGFEPFDLYLGVSAGAINLSSYLAGQFQRNFRLYTGPMSTRNFFSWAKYLRGGHHMDLDWFFQTHERDDPLDLFAALLALEDKTFIPVCTSRSTGQAVYLEPTRADFNALLKASCALPVLYRGPIRVRGHDLVDGGVADAIPVKRAWTMGAGRILVIRSQTIDFQKIPGKETRILKWHYRHHPQILATCLERPATYMGAVEFCKNPPPGCRVSTIYPERPLLSSRTSQVLDDLIQDYRLGRAAGKEFSQRSWTES